MTAETANEISTDPDDYPHARLVGYIRNDTERGVLIAIAVYGHDRHVFIPLSDSNARFLIARLSEGFEDR